MTAASPRIVAGRGCRSIYRRHSELAAVLGAVAVGELTCTPLMRRLARVALVALDDAAVHHHLGAFGPVPAAADPAR